MDWRRSRQSDNVEEAVDDGGGGGPAFRPGRGLGLGGIAVLIGIGLLLGKSPVEILGLITNVNNEPTTSSAPQTAPVEHNEQTDFVRSILGSTEDTWTEVFSASGQTYSPPKLILFHGAVESACGQASAAVGPFYCSQDERVYLDLDFFQEMDTRFHASGDLARAYVIAHEVGHHLQNLMGVIRQVDRARSRGVPMEGEDGLSVRQELQADCFAGVWANRAEQRLRWLQAGDVEGALAAATAIGDDTLQREARGRVVPDSFTHGTSAQRVRWFKKGMARGELDDCDTFSAESL
jgi:predicted metalloprotease